MTPHFVSASAGGPCSICGEPSTHKISEEIMHDEPCMVCGETYIHHEAETVHPKCSSMYHFTGPLGQRHNLTAYVCCRHFTLLLGAATGCPVEPTLTVHAHGKEWLIIQQVMGSAAVDGYFAVECDPSEGRARMPADVKYIEVKRGNDQG